MRQRAEREYGWSGLGLFTRLAVAGLALNAVVFLVLAAVLGETWPIFVVAPSALLALMFVGLAFGPRNDDD
jgi:hypothetical protein